MATLSKNQILAAKDEVVKTISVPEWGGEVCIRAMSVGERDRYENEFIRNKDKGVENFRTKFLAACLCDEDGKRLFTEADIPELSKKSIKVMNRVWHEAMSHNALTNDDVEEIAKN
jgi:hypothetical protein